MRCQNAVPAPVPHPADDSLAAADNRLARLLIQKAFQHKKPGDFDIAVLGDPQQAYRDIIRQLGGT